MIVPKDWSNLSEEEAMKCVAFLRKNLGKYKLSKVNPETIQIGDDVKISRAVKFYDDYVLCYVINGKSFCKGYSSGYDKANALFHAAEEKMKPFKTKVADFWVNNGNVVKTSCLFAVWVSLAFASGYCFYKSDVRRKERLRKEMEKEIRQKIKAEQQKQDSIIRYNDAQRIR